MNVRLGGNSDPLGIVQEIEIRTMLLNRICTSQNMSQKMRHIKFSRIQTDHLIPTRKPDFVLIEKKITCYRVDFAVLADT